ncbi:MAG: hypothetical protein LJE68_04045 [Rhodobacter sp.]|nr:hypothetical protein [Rhodobacter sp.]
MKNAISVLNITRKLAVAGLAGLLLSTFVSGPASAQAWAARHGMTGAQYQAEFNKYTGQGYRLTDVSGYSVNGTAYYAAIWQKTGGPAWVARHGMTSSKYQAAFNQYTGMGFAPALVDGYDLGATSYFAAIWQKSGGAWVARHDMTSSGYQAEFNNWTSKGYRLTDVTGYAANGQVRYAAIWKKQRGGAWVARHGMTGAQYQAAFNQYTSQGYKPSHVDGYTVNGTPYYAAIWTKGSGAYVARHGLTSAQYQAEFDKWIGKGYRLHDVSGYSAGGSARYAAIWYK